MRGKAVAFASTLVAALPVVQYVVIAALAVAAWSPRPALLAPVLLFADLLNPVLKSVAARLLPPSLTDRPSGCGTFMDVCVSCDILPRPGEESPVRGRGMPSGHCQSAALMAAYVTRAQARDKDAPLLRRVVTAALAWAAALAVAAQRILVRCHSPPQVAAGLATGAALGWLGGAVADRLAGPTA